MPIGKYIPKTIWLSAIILSFNLSAQAQGMPTSNKNEGFHSLGILISHTQISQGIQEDGKRKWLSLPSWAINYNYFFNKHWAIGLHNDIIVEDYVVDEHLKSGNSTLARTYPIGSVLTVTYKPGSFAYIIGAGAEFAKEENLFMLRIGIDYAYHISDKWELNASLINDLKLNSYNAWGIGLGLSRRLN